MSELFAGIEVSACVGLTRVSSLRGMEYFSEKLVRGADSTVSVVCWDEPSLGDVTSVFFGIIVGGLFSDAGFAPGRGVGLG